MPSKRYLPAMTWSRRHFLAASASVVVWPCLAPPQSALARRRVALKDYPFKLGVTSGDPWPDGFVLWTRLAPEPLEGGGMPEENIEVDWQVAKDELMTKVVARGTAVASPELAHSVHVEVAGLEPDRWYWYQFSAAGHESRVGRARTAPLPEKVSDRLRFAFASCQSYEQGLYTAYGHMADEDLDLVVHLGDYIYEYAGKEKQVRKHVGPVCDALEDYRNRHAQYKTDEHLQAAHAHFPWLVVWDDHEFENNYANAISENENVDQAKFLQRRARAYQAYYEHMPLRRAQIPEGPHMQLYRKASFGRLAEFALLDTRQYRSDQPCGDGEKFPCDDTYNAKAVVLGDVQERWLFDTLKASPARWNVLAQQIMMARADLAAGEKVEYSMDQWPGYEVNRQRVLKFFETSGVKNPVVITGDIHSNWVNDLQVDSSNAKSPIVATEFVGTSISSSGDGSASNSKIDAVLAENPFVRYHNRQRGYVSCEVTPERWTSHYRIVEYVTRPGAPLTTPVSFVVENGRPGAQKA